jgi:glycosyltransferase involved in cell wall biosynthesis
VRLAIPARVHERLDAFRPDLVHAHHPFLMGDTAFRVARHHGVPLVFTHHTLYERFTRAVHLDSEAMRSLAVVLGTTFANLCAAVVAPSASIEAILRERGVEVPIEVIPTGVDLGRSAEGDRTRGRRDNAMPDGCFVLGHVGRLSPEKNLGYLGEAVAAFLDQVPEARFLLVGEGEAEPEVLDPCRRHGVSDRVIRAGSLDGTDLVDAYRAMDLFVFTGLSDTQGMVLAEAMAASLPVVALDAPGARDIVRSGRNGVLVEAGAGVEEFAAVPIELAAAPDRLQRLAEGAARTALDYGVERCGERLIGFYQGVLRDWSVPEDRGAGVWEEFLERCRTEWDLLTQKADTLSAVLHETDDVGGKPDPDPRPARV